MVAAVLVAGSGAGAVASASTSAGRTITKVTVVPSAVSNERRVPASPPPSAPALTQTISVSVEGGSLELESTTALLQLASVGGSSRDWAADLPPVRVIDARGTLEGWTVHWALESLQVIGAPARGAQVRVSPNEPTVVHGSDDGLEAGRTAPARGKPRTLFSAEPGTGAGTYEAGGRVTVRLAPRSTATEVVVHLAFTVA